MQVVCAEVRILLLDNLIFFYGWSPIMEPFADRYAELRDSIAFKAGATTSEAEAYLNLGRMPITREAELRFQNSLTKFSPEERRFVRENHIIASSLNSLQVPLAPVILQVPKEASPSDTNPESSPVTKSKAIKPTPGKSRSKVVVGDTIESDLKLATALVIHHEYKDNICTNFTPISCTNLSKQCKLSKNTASLFFKKKFGGHSKYVIMCRSNTNINAHMRLLNGDGLSPLKLLKNAKEILAKPAPKPELDD